MLRLILRQAQHLTRPLSELREGVIHTMRHCLPPANRALRNRITSYAYHMAVIASRTRVCDALCLRAHSWRPGMVEYFQCREGRSREPHRAATRARPGAAGRVSPRGLESAAARNRGSAGGGDGGRAG